MCEVSYDDEPAAVWNERDVRAHKLHVCSMCGGFIRPGQVYVRHFSVFDGRPSAEKECASCVATVQKYKEAHHGISWTPSGMEQALEECIDQELDDPDEGTAGRLRMWRGELRKMRQRRETRKRAEATAP